VEVCAIDFLNNLYSSVSFEVQLTEIYWSENPKAVVGHSALSDICHCIFGSQGGKLEHLEVIKRCVGGRTSQNHPTGIRWTCWVLKHIPGVVFIGNALLMARTARTSGWLQVPCKK